MMRRTTLSPTPRFIASIVVVCLCLWGSMASAQLTFPRLGFSASATAHVDSVEIEPDEIFTLHVNMYGFEPGSAIGQEFSSISWVVLSVCCGATLFIHDIEYNDELFENAGEPYTGVLSTPTSGCVDEDMLHFATMSVSLAAPEAGEYLMVAGPFMNAIDCAGGTPIVMELPIRVIVGSDPAPNDVHSWGAVKSLYR